MKVLGISADYHDASAALVEDGRIIVAAAEERFTRLKHDPSFPRFAAEFCLSEAGLASAQELDAIVFYEEPATKFTRVLTSTLAGFPSSGRAFVNGMRSWLTRKLWVQNEISKKMQVDSRAVQFVPHHQSHAAQAFLASPFSEAAILTVDAVGEWTSTSLAHGARQSGIRVLETIPYPHSLGLVYAVFTAYLGFRPNDEECSTMALAAFGQPVYADKVRRIVRLQLDGLYEVDQSFFNFVAIDQSPLTDRFLELFGPPRDAREPLAFASGVHVQAAGTVPVEQQRFADIAASIQVVFEEAILGLAHRLARLTGCADLCMAGGAALNCVSNRRLEVEGPFARLFIPPDPGDGGAAVGAALLGCNSSSHQNPRTIPQNSPYVGKQYAVADAISMLECLGTEWLKYRIPGCSARSGDKLQIKQYSQSDALLSRVVEDLLEGRIVGWFQGRFEHGPRALGNRSLLADPANAKAVARLSRTVKKRASFRPYAVSSTEEDAHRLFEWPDGPPLTSRWMQTVARVKGECLDQVRTAVHVDGTTRPQICSAAENPMFHSLLATFGQARGLGAVLNTSFNESGYPMVASPFEALLSFLRTDMDTLVLHDTVIRKAL